MKNISTLVELIEQTALLMEMTGENQFKTRAFQKGAEALEGFRGNLEALADGTEKLPGIGDGLRSAIAEFLKTGDFALHRELAPKVPPGVLEMTKLDGLGPKRAFKLFSELGLSTLGELEYACKENRLAVAKGFGLALQTKLVQSISALKSNAGKARLDEALKFLNEQCAPLYTTPLEPVGQVGRSLEIVDRIEAAVFDDSQKADVKKLEGPHGVPVEIHVFEALPDSEKSALLRRLRLPEKLAKASAGDLKRFENWESRWLEPQWIDSGRTPREETYRLNRDGGVKGVFHCHTTESDGAGTLEEMVLEAQKLGFEYIGISDHSQSAVYAKGLKKEDLKKQSAAIKAVQKKVSIRIFHGVESDILRDGGLDYDPELLGSLDFVIASIHSRFQMKGPEMTERLVKALSNPYTTIWGHPTGRLLLDREPYDLDWSRCLQAAAKNDTAVELNCNPQRLDIDWRLGNQLVKANAKICINPDAHRAAGLNDTRLGEWIAEKSMIDRGQILNRMNVDEMEKFLWERKKKIPV